MYKTCKAIILFPYTSVQIVTSGFFEWWGAAAQTTSVDHDDDDDGDGDEVSNPPWIYSVQHLGTASVRLLTRDRNTRQSRGKGPDLWVTLKTGRSRRPLWYWFYAKFFANNNLQFVCGLAEELQHVAQAGKVGIWHQDLLLGVTLLDDLLHFLRGVHTTADHKGLETTVGSEVHIRLQSKREYF